MIKKELWTRETKFIVVCTLIFLTYLSINIPGVVSWGPGPNNANFSVQTKVNITNAFPEIININCENNTPVTLAAGTTQVVLCIVETRDYDGGGTIQNVSATYAYTSNASGSPDNNNSHYTNSTCTNENVAGYYANFSCEFHVYYYAVNGTWNLTANVTDDQDSNSTDWTNSSIYSLFALNVTELIDFGDMAVGDTSATPEEANVTNFGNRPINVSLYGFGGNDSVAGDGLAMNCSFRNITDNNERYSTDSGDAYGAMNGITSTDTLISDFQIPKQTLSDTYVINGTYWRLHLNVSDNPAGQCNGTVIFSAVQP